MFAQMPAPTPAWLHDPTVIAPNARTRKVTPKQAAKLLHVSTDTLRRWSAEGKLTVERTLGGHRRYDLAEVQSIADGQLSSYRGQA